MASTALIPALSPPWYTWGGFGSRIRVRFRLLAVEGLQQLLDRLGDIPVGDRHAMGGILTGDRSKPGFTEIAGFRPLPKLDAEAVGKAFQENGSNTAGYYRILLEGELGLTDEDISLAASLSGHSNSVVLLLHAGTRPARATFRFCNQNTIGAPSQFPLDVALLGAAEREQLTIGAPKSEHMHPKGITVSQTHPGLSVSRRPSAVRYLTWVLFSASILIAGTSVFVHRNWLVDAIAPHPATRPPIVSDSTLGFRAERTGEDLFFSWDRNSPAISGATFGMIVVKSGHDRRKILLSSDQLHTGKVFYSPTGEQTDVEMSVVGPDRSLVRESLVILLRSSEFASSRSSSMQQEPNPDLAAEHVRLVARSSSSKELPSPQPVPRKIFVHPDFGNAAVLPVREEPRLPPARLPGPGAFIKLREISGKAATAVTSMPLTSYQRVEPLEHSLPFVAHLSTQFFVAHLSRQFSFHPTPAVGQLTIDTTGAANNGESKDIRGFTPLGFAQPSSASK